MKKFTLLIFLTVFAFGFGQNSVKSLGENNPVFQQSSTNLIYLSEITPQMQLEIQANAAVAIQGPVNSNRVSIPNTTMSSAQMVDWIPVAGATETFTPDVGDFFFDPGGPGGGPDGTPGNYPNCGCITNTTLAGVSEIEFLDFEVFGNFDWLKIYDGTNNTGSLLYDSNLNTNTDTFAGMLAANGGSGVFTSTSGNFFFEFNATAVVNRLGWEVEILATGGGGGGSSPCEESSASAAFQNGFFNQAPNIAAVDVLLAADEDFTLEQITMNQFHNPGTTITSVNLTYYANASGQPGAVIGSETVVPTSQSVVGANFGFDVSTVILDVTPFLFAGQAGQSTTYWIGATVTSSNGGQTAWESNLTLQNNPMWSFFNGVWASTGEEGVYILSGQCAGGSGGGGTCVSTVYNATGLPSDIDPGATSTANCAAAPNLYPVDVTGAGIIGTDAELENVTINITHTWSGDLEISLISPSGTELALWDNVGGSGDNFTNTQFEDGGIPTTGSTAPHTGIYQPVGGTFAATFAGEDINGEWQLKICDTAGGDTGTLDSFSITFCTDEPSNNFECADAIALQCGDVETGTTVGATNSGGNGSPDVFYSYTGNGEVELVTISLCDGGTTYDSYLRIFASCGNLALGSEIVLNDDFCGLQSQVTFESDGTSTYIIMVEGFGTSSGAYSLEISCELAPVIECGGQFVDSGGPNGNYSNNEDETWTITPDNADDYVIVTFTEFDVEANWDALYVYDGPDTSAPLISSGNPATISGFPAGGYYGTTIPGPFASTHPTGTLTFRFLSDGVVTRPGWVADIACLPVPPPNDLIVNAIDVDQFAQPYTDAAVRLQFATNETLNPQGCAIAGTNGVWYKFTADVAGTAEGSVVTPSGATAVIFYNAPSENVADETELTFTPEATNQCGPATNTSITTVAGQSYYVFVLNTGGPSDVIIDLTNAILSSEDNTIDGFTFYPNPAMSTINLSAKTVLDNVSMYNMLGQKVLDQNIGATTSQLDVSNLASGTYLMQVNSEGQTGTYQIIKR